MRRAPGRRTGRSQANDLLRVEGQGSPGMSGSAAQRARSVIAGAGEYHRLIVGSHRAPRDLAWSFSVKGTSSQTRPGSSCREVITETVPEGTDKTRSRGLRSGSRRLAGWVARACPDVMLRELLVSRWFVGGLPLGRQRRSTSSEALMRRKRSGSALSAGQPRCRAT
jgi:hypothetical protein